MQRIGSVFSCLPDARGKSNKRRYEMVDAAMSAFATFFKVVP
jgi:hypothetical protein